MRGERFDTSGSRWLSFQAGALYEEWLPTPKKAVGPIDFFEFYFDRTLCGWRGCISGAAGCHHG
jgi:hypothetical protein